MELKTCPNGHTYDPSISSSCPICGGSAASFTGPTAPAFPSPEGVTIPLAYTPSGATNPTVPMTSGWEPNGNGVGPTVPLNVADSQWAPSDSTYGEHKKPEGRGMTEAVRPGVAGNVSTKAQPLTGWLVCVNGPEKGKDYRIHEEYNYIGRSPMMDISIPNDGSISWERHAIIAYDRRSRKFFFAPFGGASIVRVNDMPAMGNMELNAGDKIEIGRSTFMFVPFCGESFQWED